MTDHLGNILATVLDRKTGFPSSGGAGVVDHWLADLASTADYYPGGMMMPGRNTEHSWSRMGMQGQAKDDEIYGKGNSVDLGARQIDARTLRFNTIDRMTSNFPHFSPYLYAGNSPIAAIDYNGDHIYILSHVVGNHHGDDMFEAAALTRKLDIESGKMFNPAKDKVVILQVKDLGQIKNQVKETVNTYSAKYGDTKEFSIWSHAGIDDGPIGSTNTSGGDAAVNAVNQMSPNGWGKIEFNFAKDAYAGFYGCNTGNSNSTDGVSYTTKLSALANFKDVTIAGQTTSAFPSEYTNERSPSHAQVNDDFLPISKPKHHYNHGDPGPSNPTIRKTYMVGGGSQEGKKAFFFGTKANPMRFSKNGTGSSSPNSYQEGSKK